MQEALLAVLVSPRFLYRAEVLADDAATAPDALDDWALASRLSYFLWGTTPDRELLSVARDGQLVIPAVLSAQASRLLDDPRSKVFSESFASQWLGLRKLDIDQISKRIFPSIDAEADRFADSTAALALPTS